MQLDELGDRIRQERKIKKWTQAQLAKYADLSINTVKKIEAGFVEEVGIKKVDAVLDLFGLEFSLRLRGYPPTLEELQHAAD